MRTKSLVIAAAALTVGLLSASAQVYSLNIVGYVNVTVPAQSYKLIANPLNAPTNTLKALLPSVPPGSQFYKFNTTWNESYLFDDLDMAWTGDTTFAPGEGGMFRNNETTNITLTFVGEVLTGNLTNNIPAGYAIVSSKAPIGASLDGLGFPKTPGDQVYTHSGTWTGSYLFDDLDLIWTGSGPGGSSPPEGPTISVGQAFMSRKAALATWVKTFNP